MLKKVSDYVADFLVEKGITDVFSVVGGGAMHLNDSLGHHPKLHCIYNHHEQASAMAAEAYARLADRPAVVCVTSGPGALNTLNGVAGAYQDSVPMLVISGQMKSTLIVKQSGLHLRTLGGQEFDIVSAVTEMTKYAETVLDPKKIRYYLEKAYYISITGRMGPTWLDIPVDIQGMYIETDELEKYENQKILESTDLHTAITEILQRLKQAKRPVLYAGNGIRFSGGFKLLHQLKKVLDIPVVTCWNSIDLMATNDSYYAGRAGTMGDRAGNFAVQNSDFLLCIGTRLSIYQVGYNVKTWARAAYTVVVDIDAEELKKPTIRVDLPIVSDAKIFMENLLQSLRGKHFSHFNWLKCCQNWKNEYPVVLSRYYKSKDTINVYAFMDVLSRSLPDDGITVVSNGSASVVGSHAYFIKEKSRFIMNCAISSMGYGLPAAIGAAVATKKIVVCIEGDGSLMMNLQELQTMVTNHLPVKLFVINNNGYHQIRQTQNNIFKNSLVGVGPESHDLGFPNFKKLAIAFGVPYVALRKTKEMKTKILKILEMKQAVFCEAFVDSKQVFSPKSQAKKLLDGTITSPPLEDMAPFLSREELRKNMFIPLVDE